MFRGGIWMQVYINTIINNIKKKTIIIIYTRYGVKNMQILRNKIFYI